LGGDAYHAPVVAVTQSGVTTYYYVLRDYLGNITHVYNSSNSTTQEYSFDAWGRRRNPTNWGYDLTSQPESFADRGFTSHEFLKYFNLYNMNGRMYDPLVGRFISPDPFVQAPGNTQSLNRYTYAMNNPLVYVDYNGYTWFSKLGKWIDKNANQIITIAATVVVVAAVTVATAGMGTVAAAAIVGGAGGFTSGALGTALNGGSFGQILGSGFLNAGIGALSGMAGGAAAGWVSKHIGNFAINALEVSGKSAIGGAISGAFGGAAAGAAGGFVTGLATGGLDKAWEMAGQGAIFGGISGAALGGYRGYRDAKALGKNPWTGIDRKVSGRTEPVSLSEQLTLEEAQSGQGEHIMEGKINDPKWKGWQKIEHTHALPDGNNITIHYWHNPENNVNTGFKFKTPPRY
jgi:RHS repeat-associated protein